MDSMIDVPEVTEYAVSHSGYLIVPLHVAQLAIIKSLLQCSRPLHARRYACLRPAPCRRSL